MSESVTLLRKRGVSNDNNTSCCINYHPQRIHSKGAILCLLVRFLLAVSNTATIFATAVTAISIFEASIITYLAPSLQLFSPIVGWIADAWFGRYQVIKVGVYVSLVSNILAVSAAFISYMSTSILNHNAFEALAYIFLSISMCDSAAFTANIIQFSIDQCLGATGDELSVLSQWNIWTSHFAHCIFSIWTYSMSNLLLLREYALYITAPISIVFSITTTIVFYIGKRWLDTTHQVTNPIKLIAQVLNYSRKNKYPRNRSSLTFLEEDYPSRLDLGKEKYGGPFSEEEVEDVRTILQLTPLLVCAMLYKLLDGKIEQWFNYMSTNHVYMSLGWIISVTPNLAFAIFIPVFYFIIHPIFYKYLPSMFKAIGTGVFILFLSLIVQIALDIVIHTESEEPQQCTFKNDTIILLIDYRWIILQETLYSIGSVILVVSLMQFVVAQTPEKMKGLTIGLYYISIAVGFLIGHSIYIPFENISSSKWLNCELYTDIAELILFSVISIIFLILAKRYQLRIRERTINIHLITEDNYGQYLDKEEEYRREHELSYGSTSSTDL